MNRRISLVRSFAIAVLAAAFVLSAAYPAAAQVSRGSGNSMADLQAARLLQNAQELLEAGEADRGVKLLEEILRQFPTSRMRFKAQLELGRHFMDVHEQPQAIKYLSSVKQIPSELGEDEEMPADMREVYLEGLYLTGVAYYQMRNYAQSFPTLRKITTEFPNSVWANQSYYYIGMCHFAQNNWTKAIEALSLVGTFVDPDSPTIQYAETGRRFYVRLEDSDLPVMYRLGKEVSVVLESSTGDKETVTPIPLSGEGDIFVGSIPTSLAKAKPGDNVMQVYGGDTVTVTYQDGNTRDGEANVMRQSKVRLVSTASLNFTQGDYKSATTAAFISQPAFVTLHDADLDSSDKAETVSVRLVARFKKEVEDQDDSGNINIDRFMTRAEDDEYETRDEVTLTLTEIGDSPIRTGRFGGQVMLESLPEDTQADRSDDVISCLRGDEIVVTYLDDLHIFGDTPRTVTAKATVVNEILTIPRVTQYIVEDQDIAAQKNIVEASAYLELARIFRSMGLKEGSDDRAEEGLYRVGEVIKSASGRNATVADERIQQAYKLRWELHLVMKNYTQAMATCRLFSKLYPESAFVDEALMGMADAFRDQEDPVQAIRTYEEVIRLQNSTRKAEAMYQIAGLKEMQANKGNRGDIGGAIEAYKKVAESYPDSPFAGEALAKVIDYRIDSKDYSMANDLLEQVFLDYPDAEFLDSMLLKWVIVAFKMNDNDKALEKCQQLIFQYPHSKYAAKANQILPQLQKRAGNS